MTRRIFPINDWAPAQEAMLDKPGESSAMGATLHQDAGASSSQSPRLRSQSSSLPWRRPKSFLFGHEHHNLSRTLNDLAIDDTEEEGHESQGSGQAHGREARHEHSDHHEHHHHHLHPPSFKGMIRRASMSLKGIVHRRPSVPAEGPMVQRDHYLSRPTTSHSTWNKIRHATNSFRHTATDLRHDPDHFFHRRSHSTHLLPIPGFGDEPPVIPSNSGAAAKASAAMQNEYFARQSKLLNPSTSDDLNDRESGIGIAATIPIISMDDATDLSMTTDEPSTNISKIDFIHSLPTELAIQVLANLDAAALAKASQVSRCWNKVVADQHVWRESCLREMTKTYATSQPVVPGTGLGIPPLMAPENDWKEIYRVKHQLNRRWKQGKARPVYLKGHCDSIYCLQFDE